MSLMSYRTTYLGRDFSNKYFTNLFITAQSSKECADFELRVIDCVDAYGFYRAEDKCRNLIADFHECVFMTKQVKRSILMYQERSRQVKEGKREFLPPPPLDLY